MKDMSKGSGGTRSTNSKSAHQSNTYVSQYGFKNVGVYKATQHISGVSFNGTVRPSVESVQQYLDTGSFDRYGTNNGAKNMILSKITEDMQKRGFAINHDSSNVMLTNVDGDSMQIKISYSNKGHKWIAKNSMSNDVNKNKRALSGRHRS